jgi:hypothetical protein
MLIQKIGVLFVTDSPEEPILIELCNDLRLPLEAPQTGYRFSQVVMANSW